MAGQRDGETHSRQILTFRKKRQGPDGKIRGMWESGLQLSEAKGSGGSHLSKSGGRSPSSVRRLVSSSTPLGSWHQLTTCAAHSVNEWRTLAWPPATCKPSCGTRRSPPRRLTTSATRQDQATPIAMYLGTSARMTAAKKADDADVTAMASS